MALMSSVGFQGVNNYDDILFVRLVLRSVFNLSRGEPPNAPCTPFLIEDIKSVQTLGSMKVRDGRIDPGGATEAFLRTKFPRPLDPYFMQAIATRAEPAAMLRFFEPLLVCMKVRGINTPLRQTHFLAQIVHESGNFRYTEEIASGEAYEGRRDLGNFTPGDGKRYKGRGLIQLTGRANYGQYSRAVGFDFVRFPEVLSMNARYAVDVAGWFWENRKCNDLADLDDLELVTRKINGGINGLEHRRVVLRRAKFLLLGK